MINFTIRRDNGRRIIWEESQISYIISEYQKGTKTSELAKLFNVSSEAIRALLKRNNIHVMSVKERAYKEYPRNSNFFEKIDNPIKAYWLGFLYADGCVTTKNSFTMELAAVDKKHLEQFQQDIGAVKHKLSYKSKTTEKGTFCESYVFNMKDKKFCEDLIKQGCVPRKSLILTFPSEEQVPSEFIYDFIRGYFDGDGCVNICRNQMNYSMVGTKEFLEEVKKFLNLNNALQKPRNNKAYILKVDGNKKSKFFFDKIYNDPIRYLERKYKKVKNFYSYCA